jgi:hypothetical protein
MGFLVSIILPTSARINQPKKGRIFLWSKESGQRGAAASLISDGTPEAAGLTTTT